ncbi:hypothetical protein BDV96DRAFT_642815 [Lophiotrema nucula]|uniref:Azaphilone pigments biosynthesis cluster protein L N-terminal domain-containing protein n=1 Tax=Lophiotrema nucula TaxID=690887 RepID=A0A6A5ZHF1_9PLEO|nr:hypothetical protein BDV96DRAFT_642815 [Lophiotrema nucula]
MADPLSVIASVVGIVGAGTKLAITLYDLCDKAKNAPHSIREIASNLSLLSTILENIADVLKRHKDVYEERLLTDTEAVLKKYDDVQTAVRALIIRQDGFRVRLKWALKDTKVRELLVQIEGVKSALSLVLGCMNLAIAVKHPGKDLQKRTRLQRLVESVVRENRQSIIALSSREWSSLTEEELEALEREREGIKREKEALRRVKRTMRSINLDTDSSSSDRDRKEIKLERQRALLEKKEMMRKEKQHERAMREPVRALRPEWELHLDDEPKEPQGTVANNDTATWLFGLVFGSQPMAIDEKKGIAVEKDTAEARSEMATGKEQAKLMMQKGQRPKAVRLPPPPQVREIKVSDTIINLLKSWTSLNETEIDSMAATKEDREQEVDEDNISSLEASERDMSLRRWKLERELEDEAVSLSVENERIMKDWELQQEKDERRRFLAQHEEAERQQSIAEFEARKEREKREAEVERKRIIHESELRREKELKEKKMMEERIIKEYLEKQAVMKAKAEEERARIIDEWEREKAERTEKRKVEGEMLLQELRKQKAEADTRRLHRSEQQSHYDSNPASAQRTDARSDASDDDRLSDNSVERKTDMQPDEAEHFERHSSEQAHDRKFKTYRSLDGLEVARCMDDTRFAHRYFMGHHDHGNKSENVSRLSGHIFLGSHIAENPAQTTLTSTLFNNGLIPMLEDWTGVKRPADKNFSYLSRSEVLTGSQLWQSTSAPGRSELFEALCEIGWRPLYLRGTGAGQTWYYGSRAVHVEF